MYRVQEYLDRRCFVPDELVINLVRDKLKQCSVPEGPSDAYPNGFPRGRGALLDGFPRTQAQADMLNKMVSVDRVVFLEANDKALREHTRFFSG